MARALSLIIRNLAFTVVVPGLGGVYVPWLILTSGGHTATPAAWEAVPVIAAGTALYAWCVWNFAAAGQGTPGLWDAPRRVVATGPYRWVRNPIYLAALAIVGGGAWLFWSLPLLEYAAAMAVFFHLFVLGYEEPRLRRRFGATYLEYRRTVPRWIPRPTASTATRSASRKEPDMARIQRAPARSLRIKLIYYFTRRSLARLAGREPERMLEPLQMFAHSPALLTAYAKLEHATAGLHNVDNRLSDLAELKAATLVSCEYCIDLGSAVARRRSGLTDEQLLALPRYRDSKLFTEPEKLVLDYAACMSRTPVDVPDELFARLREHFDEAQLVELTHHIALENLRGRFNLALGIGPAGFSEGKVVRAAGQG